MRISARNQYPGRISRVIKGAVNAEVHVALPGDGQEIVSIITNDSVDRLGLTEGKDVTALVKVSSILLLVGGDGANTSARNRLCGRITVCQKGAVNAEVIVTLPNGAEVAATVTNDSVERLGLEVGVEVCALFKASNVILAVD